jgi:hypothetical protein
MKEQQQMAEQALEQSGLKVEKLSPQQHQEILDKLSERLSPPPAAQASDDLEMFSINIGCIACEVGLNVVAAIPIGALIVAGVAVGPELAAVVTIAGFFGVSAASVATVINTALAAGGGASVEGVIASLCESFGAC